MCRVNAVGVAAATAHPLCAHSHKGHQPHLKMIVSESVCVFDYAYATAVAHAHTSHLTPHTSHISPQTSHLTPHTSHLTPHTSHLTRTCNPCKTCPWPQMVSARLKAGQTRPKKHNATAVGAPIVTTAAAAAAAGSVHVTRSFR